MKVEQEFSDEVKKLVNYFPGFMAIEIYFCFVAAVFSLSTATQVNKFVRTLQTKSYGDKSRLCLFTIYIILSRRLDRLHCYNFHSHRLILLLLLWIIFLNNHFEVDFQYLLQAVQNFNVQSASFVYGLKFSTLSIEVCIMRLSLFYT